MTRTTKSWKAVDFSGQIAMIFLPLIYVALSGIRINEGVGFLILIVLSGWQIGSFFIHRAFRHAPWIARGRTVYTYLICILGAAGLITLGSIQLATGYLFCLLLISPIMSLLYLTVSYREWQRAGLMMVRGRQAL